MTACLTDAFLKTLKPGQATGVAEYRDSEVRGLEIRVWPSGKKAWRLHYTRRSDGRRRAVGLGTYPSVSLKDARREARHLRGKVEDHDVAADPAGERTARRQAATFSDLAEDWIELHGKINKSARALRDDLSMLRRHVMPEIGAVKVNDITKRDIIRLLDVVSAKGDARPGLARARRRMTHRPNRVFELVRSIFRWAVSRDVLQHDPTQGMKPPIRKERPRERDLSAGEVGVLWSVLDSAPIKRRTTKGLARGEEVTQPYDLPFTRSTALALKLSLVTGQRIGEVTGMAIAELSIDDTAPIWIIPGSRTKNGEPNRVPLSRLALRLISDARTLAHNSSWVFPNPKGDGPIDPHAPTRALGRARAAIGLTDFRVHDLRRTAATQMAEIGVSPHTISLVLNHISARRGTVTGKAYVRYSYDREKREALNAWGMRLEQIIRASSGSAVEPAARRYQS